MAWDWIAVAILGVWRITHLLVAEDGPADLILKLRLAVGDGVVGRGLDCFYCTSVWVAAPFAVVCGDDWVARLVLWPAISGGAILAERLSRSERITGGEEGRRQSFS